MSYSQGLEIQSNFFQRTKTLYTSLGIFLAANATDMLTTFTFLHNGTGVEGNNFLEKVNPLLSPAYVINNYGLEGVIPHKLVGCALMVSTILILRSIELHLIGQQEFSIAASRGAAVVFTAVSIWNLM